MNPAKTKKLFIGVVIALAVVVALTFASALFLLLTKGDVKTARPHTTLKYLHLYNDQSNKKASDALFIAHLLSGALFAVLVVVIAKPSRRKLFGDYRFAKAADVEKAGLFQAQGGEAGIFLGKFGPKYLIYRGQEFAMVYAPTRSGKGVNIVVPNLLQFPDSVVCTDIKFENFELTSGYRQQHGQKVYLFAPGSPDKKGHRWNPVGYISDDRYDRLTDIDRLANYLIPTPPNTDPMWTSEGRSLFKAVLLLVLDTPHLPNTLSEVLRQLRTERPTKDYFENIMEKRGSDLDPECIMGLSEFVNAPGKTAGGIKKSVTGALNVWANPMVDAATETNDFDLRKLRREPMSIYLGVSSNDLEAFAPVFNLFIQQLIDLNTRKGDLPPRYATVGTGAKIGKLFGKHQDEPQLQTGNPEIKNQCLLLLDEFCALGRMESLAKAVSFIAGYNLRLMPIFQSEAQLIGTYTANTAENIIENHSVRVVFPPNRMKNAKVMSEDIGSTTVLQTSVSKPRDFQGNRGTKSESEARRALLLPEEIKAMADDEQIILARSCDFPIFSKRIKYFENKDFKKRILPPVEIPTITPTDYPVRGKKPPKLHIIMDRVTLPQTTDEKLTEQEIDGAVDSFFDLANEASEEFEQSNVAAIPIRPEMIEAVDNVFKEMARA